MVMSLLSAEEVTKSKIKRGRNATVDSYVSLVSHLIQNLYCRVCRPAENVLNVEYSVWRTKILSDEHGSRRNRDYKH